jgi:CubicO group peptidase (beta-lactamase class C family)
MKKAYFLLPCALLILAGTGRLAAQTAGNPSVPDIPTIVDSLLYSKTSGLAGQKGVIGASVGVYWKGKTYCFSYGLADKERGLKADTNTLYEIGSNTKIFTDLMLSAEMAAGRLTGNEYVEQYVPLNKNIRHKVRLTDLANHISGLPTFHDSASLAELAARDTTRDPLQMVTSEYMLSVLKKVDTLHLYGKYMYSNFGVGLLGYILQQYEHESYPELLQRMICRPLGMRSTTAAPDTSFLGLARGYRRGMRAPFINLCSGMQGAGAIKSSITDMMRFIRAQLEGNPSLQPALDLSHKACYKGNELQIAMGWHIHKMYNTPFYEMYGDTYGASSTMMFAPEHGLGIVVLLNSANSGAVTNAAQRIIAKLLDTAGSENRYAMPEISVSREYLDRYIGTYELEPGLDAMVTAKDGKLFLQLTGQPSLPFKAVADQWFVLEKYGCQLEFEHSAGGPCPRFYLYQNGEKIPCNRK